MAEYIKCRNCESPDCKGCNLKRLETMLENGKFDCMMNENRCINTSADVEPVQEWIPVTERLPDWRDGKVLVFTKYGFSICERTVNNRWRGQHANWITHWTYLPQPPKGE